MSKIAVRLSGTIEVVRDDTPVALTSVRVRALLVMLALAAGRSVSVDALARALWDEDPPENIRASVQTFVARLRRTIGSEVVQTDSSGYRLAIPPDSVDLLRFTRLIESAADDGVEEASTLDEALAIWAGEPCGQAPSEWIEHNVVPGITERYLQSVERRADLALAEGAAAGWIPRLRQLVERHPLRETLWARLIAALDASGRTAEALDRYEALRTHLADELGVDPTAELQHVHHRLLTQEAPSLSDVPRRPAPARQIPPAVAGFTGRSDQLAALDAILADDESSLIALHGPGGVGKTTLAVHWATRNSEHFPDGQLWVDLRGYGPGDPVEPLEALDTLLRGLDVPGNEIPDDVDGRSALLRTELSNKRALVVLDNAHAASQVRPLLSEGPTTVVTSRSQLRGLASRENAQRIAIEPMPIGEAVALLAARLGAADDAELAELAELCGRLPVAISVAAERAGRDGKRRIAAVNERLRDERDRLETLTGWSDDPLTDVRAVFSWSYHALDDDTARMFRLLGKYPHARIASEAAAAMAGVDARTAERLLDGLTDQHLLTEIELGWYELHDLPHTYAVELAGDDATESAGAVRRLRSWYLHSVRNARSTYSPARVALPLPEPLPKTSPMRFRSHEQAVTWFVDHLPALRSVLTEAATDGDDMTPTLITPHLFRFFKYLGASREAVDLYTLAQRCARRTGDRTVEAVCAYFLAHGLDHLGDTQASLSVFEEARALFAGVDHANGRVGTELTIGTLYAKLGRFEESIEAQENALRNTQDASHSVPALILNNLASTYHASGRIGDAIETARRAIAEHDAAHDPDLDMLAAAHVTLGESYSADGRWPDAAECLGKAVDLFHELGNTAREILALQLRGTAHREYGDVDAARDDWTTALKRLELLGREAVPTHMAAAAGTYDELQRLLGTLDSAS